MLLSAVTFETASGEYQQRVKLRSTYKSLSKSDHDGFQNLMIGKLGGNQEDGRIIEHNYKLETIDGDKVVTDGVTGLMWHQSGSSDYMRWNNANNWIRSLNYRKYAGYQDWRLPTLEEAVSLLESEPAFADMFGQEFINTYAGVKRGEFETFMQVISPWEREFLLLNV